MTPSRLVGIDAARALALVGMFAAHLIDVEHPVDWSEPSTWWSIVAGRSSVLFATLAGVSLALVTGRDRPVTGSALTVARKRVAVRGAVIAGLGLVLMAFGTPVAVILTTYGLLFFAMLPALTWSRRRLLVVAGVLTLLASPFAVLTTVLLYDADTVSQQVLLFYPLVTFAAYLLLGLAIGRCDLTSPRVSRILLAIGAAAGVVAYTAGEAVTPGGALYQSTGQVRLRAFVFASEPHSSTLVDMVGSAGVAVAVIGLCGMLAARGRGPTAPLRVLAAIGSKPLTIYAAHIVVIALLIGAGVLPGFGDPDLAVVSTLPGEIATWACFVAGAVALGLAIGARRGPLESLVGGMARRLVPAA
jgi:uncharacterized membrane protein YeiB